MGIGIPVHLLATYVLALKRVGAGGLSGWQSPLGDNPAYWEGEGYVSLPLSRAITENESGSQTGQALFYFDPDTSAGQGAEGGQLPKASDKCLVDGVEFEVIAVRPPNSLIDYWKIELKTGAS
jgi:hypothetical protein